MITSIFVSQNTSLTVAKRGHVYPLFITQPKPSSSSKLEKEHGLTTEQCYT